MVGARGWAEEEKGDCCVMGIEFQPQDKKVLEIFFTHVNIWNSINCILKWLR